LVIGKGLDEILRQLPNTGPLFPTITKMDDRSRACFMWKLCKRVNIQGVSLHSYRYSWAERAKVAGTRSVDGGVVKSGAHPNCRAGSAGRFALGIATAPS
jgi:hypothetical protein